MLNWLKHLVAGRELAELERWRVECAQAQRWLCEFYEADAALYYLRRAAEGKEASSELSGIRDALRTRRATPRPLAIAPVVYPAPGLHGWHPKRAVVISAPLPEPTLYDVGMQSERGIDYRFLGVTGEEADQ